MSVAVNHQVFSSKWELGGVRLEDQVRATNGPASSRWTSLIMASAARR
jgi:hypothetical protein